MTAGVTRREAMTAVAGALAFPRFGLPQDDLALLSLKEAGDALRAKRVSSEELTKACLLRIERYAARYNTFVTVTEERAIARARAMDEEIARGRSRGALHGIPIALKDNMDTAGIRTTAASAVFADRVPTEDAEVVRRLDAAGAVLLGKLNLHEFAFGGGSVSYYGPMRNPWAPDRVAGGSSGGSGIAVAAAFCYGALGTDTGGSIRDPAANCGIVGLKPTYGRVSNRNVIPLCWSLDHVGPMTRTVEDAALLLQPIAGYDALDPTSVDAPVPDYAAAIGRSAKGLRVGVPRGMFFDNLHPEVAAAVESAIDALRSIAGGVREVTLPSIAPLPWDAFYSAEIAAYHLQLFRQAPSSYQPATRKSLQGAASASVADYVLAARELSRLRREIGSSFTDVDLLVVPTTPAPPRTIEEEIERAESEKPLPPELGCQWQLNVFGIPAISIPCGFTESGIPIGFQIAGPRFGEENVLTLAHAYQQGTDWHRRRPVLEASG
jgi:aspartyl-tRNA(Asn)/glutamyl-tRNA(Gln) amidotransferase subunit A